MEAITISKEGETITITKGTTHIIETTNKEIIKEYFFEFITNKK